MEIYRVSQTFEDVESLVKDEGMVEFANLVLKFEKEDGEMLDVPKATTTDEAIEILEKAGYEVSPCGIEWEQKWITVCK